MSCSVNLLPVRCRERQGRIRRRAAWLQILGAALVPVIAIWVLERTAAENVRHMSRSCAALEQQREFCVKQLGQFDDRRRTLVQRVQMLAHMQQRAMWAERLAQLASDLPEGVVLTSVQATPNRSKQAITTPLVVLGYAADSNEVNLLLARLQKDERWRQVLLANSRQSSFAGRPAVEFELRCEPRKEPA